MSRLCVQVGVAAAECHWNDVVDGGAHKVWMLQLRVDALVTDAAFPSVAFEYFAALDGLVFDAVVVCSVSVVAEVLVVRACPFFASAISLVVFDAWTAELDVADAPKVDAASLALPVAVSVGCG